MKFTSLALLIAGVILLFYGLQSHDSIASTVNETVTGSPTNKTIWLLVLGVILSISGAAGLFRGSK